MKPELRSGGFGTTLCVSHLWFGNAMNRGTIHFFHMILNKQYTTTSRFQDNNNNSSNCKEFRSIFASGPSNVIWNLYSHSHCDRFRMLLFINAFYYFEMCVQGPWLIERNHLFKRVKTGFKWIIAFYFNYDKFFRLSFA